MKNYKVELLGGNIGLLRLDERRTVEDKRYWQHLGSLKPERAAMHILIGITNDVDLALKYAYNFELYFLGISNSYPRIINSGEVLDWLQKQVKTKMI